MRTRRGVQLALLAGMLGLALSTPAGAQARDISRDTLAPNDGWAAADGGTTGGSTADDAERSAGSAAMGGRSSAAPSWLVAPHRGGAAYRYSAAPLQGERTSPGPLSDISRDILAPNDGWAAADGGTTGGSTADDAHVFTVRNRSELVRALDGGSATPKIIRIAGTIDANTDDDGDHLDCADYATDGYSTRKYLAAYDPRTWGSAKPSGPQEEARQASAAQQAERIELTVGSHTTLVGLGDNAVLKGASLQLRGANNVIVRNLELRDAYDCFPVWQPNTGGLGDWKTAYDNIWLRGATHVWIDHVSLSDKGHLDEQEPTYFGRNYLRHDGLLDITNASDLVTVSWSRFADHDKAMLIGNGDTATGDRGKLRVTLHHNEFESVVQRAPRVRFGQVHLYNNRYVVPADAHDYRYSIGVSTESGIYAENNAFTTPGHVEVADLVKSWNGTALHQSGTLFNGYPVDLLAIHNAYNSGSERDLTADVGWTPTLHTKIDSAATADREVARGAGAGRTP